MPDPKPPGTDELLVALTEHFSSVYRVEVLEVDIFLRGHERPVHLIAPPPAGAVENPGAVPLSPSERAVLTIIEQTGRRMIGDEIRRELCHPNGPYGETTINRDLARLVRIGRIDNPRKGAGYGLSGWE
jgi:hypothetical protein